MYLRTDRMLKYSSAIWSHEELAEPEERSISATRGQFRLSPRWFILAVLLGMLVGWWGWSNWHVSTYDHVLQQNATWITQQTNDEMTCFSGTTTPAQQLVCARQVAQSVHLHQQRFNAVTAPSGQRDAATKMQIAFAALTASSCYDSASDTLDAACVPGITSRLRMAQLDAQDALQN